MLRLNSRTATFWGFGPFFKYSRFETSLLNPTSGAKNEYPAEDISLGLKLNLGLIVKWDAVSVRFEIPYSSEKCTTWAWAQPCSFSSKRPIFDMSSSIGIPRS